MDISKTIKDAYNEGELETPVNIALIQKPLDEGLIPWEAAKLMGMLSSVEMIPLDIQAEGSCAMGFIATTDAEWMDYDFHKLEAIVQDIISDTANESEDGLYDVPNNHGVSRMRIIY